MPESWHAALHVNNPESRWKSTTTQHREDVKDLA